MYLINQKHPEWQLSALVRTDEKAAQIQRQYPNVRIVRGDLDAVDVIEKEVRDADIVYRTFPLHTHRYPISLSCSIS